MSGWYVELLLMNREAIRQNIYNNEYEESTGLIESFVDLDDATYNDLLDVERAVNILVKNGSLDRQELDVINLVISIKSLSKAGRELGLSRATITKIFKNACFKVSYFLGGHFTDDGYIDYLKEKYKLTPEQVEKIYKYLEGNYRLREVNIA
jgi:DNA-binding CsgD family transcriptional regulator